jgi:D-alanyl-D-alanine carboxypeptidase
VKVVDPLAAGITGMGTGTGQASTHGVVARADDGGRRWIVR